MSDIKINTKELGEFLLEAKRNTYASGEKGKRLPNGSKQFVFSNENEDNYTYIDTYFEDDPNPFIGQEIVYKISDEKKIPIWGMNYYGWLTEEGKKYPDQKGLTNFLQEALRANNRIYAPFRGSDSERTLSDKQKLVYLDSNEGDIFNFNGDETIYLFKGSNHPLLFKLEYHGGII